MLMSQVIFDLAAEGGGVTLYGKPDGDGWRFWKGVIDQTPLLIDEPSIQYESDSVGSWEEALGLIQKYSWHKFGLRSVHPDFRDRLWEAYLKRWNGEEIPWWRSDTWRRHCGK